MEFFVSAYENSNCDDFPCDDCYNCIDTALVCDDAPCDSGCYDCYSCALGGCY